MFYDNCQNTALTVLQRVSTRGGPNANFYRNPYNLRFSRGVQTPLPKTEYGILTMYLKEGCQGDGRGQAIFLVVTTGLGVIVYILLNYPFHWTAIPIRSWRSRIFSKIIPNRRRSVDCHTICGLDASSTLLIRFHYAPATIPLRQ